MAFEEEPEKRRRVLLTNGDEQDDDDTVESAIDHHLGLVTNLLAEQSEDQSIARMQGRMADDFRYANTEPRAAVRPKIPNNRSGTRGRVQVPDWDRYRILDDDDSDEDERADRRAMSNFQDQQDRMMGGQALRDLHPQQDRQTSIQNSPFGRLSNLDRTAQAQGRTAEDPLGTQLIARAALSRLNALRLRGDDVDDPPPRYEDGNYTPLPSPRNNLLERPTSGIGFLAPPPPPEYRSPSPSAGGSKWPWTFPDGPAVMLSLDAGGGNRTMKQLDMLETLMRKISAGMGLDCSGEKNVLKPCNVFHLIVSSGTGGMIAILLGRLRMSVAEVKEFYAGIEKDVFGPLMELKDLKSKDKSGFADNLWSHTEHLGIWASAQTKATEQLEKEVVKLVRNRNMGTNYFDPKEPGLGRVLVAAVHHSQPDFYFPVTLPSYPGHADKGIVYPGGPTEPIRPSIVEAVRATMANSLFFKLATITGTQGTWLGSPTRYLNSVKLLMQESKHAFPGHRKGRTSRIVVNIGAVFPELTEDLSSIRAPEAVCIAGDCIKDDMLPDKMTFNDVLDWNARVCARIEFDKGILRNLNGQESGSLTSIFAVGRDSYTRLNHSTLDIADPWPAEEVANSIKSLRQYCIEKEFQKQTGR